MLARLDPRIHGPSGRLHWGVAPRCCSGLGPARSAGLSRLRGRVLECLAAVVLVVTGMAPAHAFFHHQALPLPADLHFRPGPPIPHPPNILDSCVQLGTCNVLNAMGRPVNLKAVMQLAPPGTSVLNTAGAILNTQGVASNGHVLWGANKNLDSAGLRAMVDGAQAAGRPPLLIGLHKPGLPVGHTVMAGGMYATTDGKLFYVVIDSAPGAPHGGRYLVPAKSIESLAANALEPLPPGEAANPALKPHRDEFGRRPSAGLSGTPDGPSAPGDPNVPGATKAQARFNRVLGGAVSGAAVGAVSTYVVCMALGNTNEQCLAAAGQAVPEAAFWGAVAASGPFGLLVASAYGAAHGAVNIAEASDEFIKLVRAVSEELRGGPGDLDDLVRARASRLLASLDGEVAVLQQRIAGLGQHTDRARQEVAPIRQAAAGLDAPTRQLHDAQREIERIRRLCETNRQRRLQIDQFILAVRDAQQARAGCEGARAGAGAAAQAAQQRVATALATANQLWGNGALTQVATALRDDDALIQVLLASTQPVASAERAAAILTGIRTACQTPVPSLGTARDLARTIPVSADGLKRRADLLERALPERASQIRVTLLGLREEIARRTTSLATFNNELAQTCSQLDQRAEQFRQSGRALQVQLAAACPVRIQPIDPAVLPQLVKSVQDVWRPDGCGKPATAGAPVTPQVASGGIYVYVLDGIGVVMARQDVVSTRPHCQWTGGGPRPCPGAPPAKAVGVLGGPYASEQAAKADMKAKLDCFNGYWGAFINYGSGKAWLQNNITTGDCRSLKQL